MKSLVYSPCKMGNASEVTFVSTIAKEYDFLLGTAYTIFGVFSLMGNTILLLVAYRKKSSLKPAEFFIVNLSISDLGMTISLFPLAIPSAFSHRWLFTETICSYYAFCGVLFGLCSLSNLTVLSSVCWFKVCCPNYGNKFSSSHALLLVVGVWCYSAIFAVGPLSGWGQYGSEPYGTACCIDWYAPYHSQPAMSYIICLFFFCYIVPCTIIFLSYAYILMTVRGSQQAVQQHVSPQNKIVNAQTLIAKLSVAVCIGFLVAWSPYAAVSMWAAFVNPNMVPPVAFAFAAIFAKSSTLYNPMVYLGFKPNFRKSLCRDVAKCKRALCPCLCRSEAAQKSTCHSSQHSKEECHSTRLSNGLHESHRTCRHCPDGSKGPCTDTTPQRTAMILTGSTHSEVVVSQLSNEMQSDFL
ncbi:opsin 7, group member b isoform X1 [Pygocentrus nattereri]|uniref:G-protein coupled receptors family 1 profile domain-containing protein n=2 Tax=Pygocentrus nattereri TaxID=42514 RepID=A0A3B4EG34_PYGNA|nr:opsin 7, group member b isoform X1 [Pygocentrus nattereri]